jgi:hypothetical protein
VTRWLLNTFTTWQLALVVVGGFVVLGVVGLLLVRRLLPRVAEGPFDDVAGIVAGLVAAVYGIILAFVIVALYEDFKAAESTVRAEATALAQVYENTRALSPEVRVRMSEEVSHYAAAVRGDEWRRMRDGEESPDAWRHIRDMYRVLIEYEPQGDSESTFYGEAVGKLDDVVGTRQERLDDAAESLPTPFQILLWAGAVPLVASLYFLGGGLGRRPQMIVVVIVAGLVGFNLFVAVVLDHPFSGDVAVSNEHFTEGPLADVVSGPESPRGP